MITITGLVLVKIGGSIITDVNRENTAKPKVIRRLADEVKIASENANVKIGLGHGSGSFGHVSGSKYKTHLGLIHNESKKGASLTQHVAASLHRIVINEFCNVGANPLSFPPSSAAITTNRRIIEWDIRPITTALRHGFIPITCGDVTLDTELGVTIVSTEEPLRYIANKLKPERVIMGGDVDGVYTANPKLAKYARLVDVIDKHNIKEALSGVSGSTKVDVTGGMRSKLEYAYEIAKSCGASVHIVNAEVPGRLYSAMVGDPVTGTVVRV
ncbi:MAG: isopentenyl phosphate kinase [Candidatus Marsarchaeota archaeon]|nr:isopentenyl phosphate kinase [Candidatus Marsarchaeota archaeon]